MRNYGIFKGKGLDDAVCVESLTICGMMPVNTVTRIKKAHDEPFMHLFFILFKTRPNVGNTLYDACVDNQDI